MQVLAIDPGTTESAYVLWNGTEVLLSKIVPNEELMTAVRHYEPPLCGHPVVAIEMIACYGMAVGKEVFETVLFIGKLMEALRSRNMQTILVYRRDVKLHHCQSSRAKDANVRQALIDKYGAPGTKKVPGKTYGLKSHLWSAFAIAAYLTETQQNEIGPTSNQNTI